MLYLDIKPQTRITLCRGVAFDNTYSHVRFFETQQEKLNYFNSHMATVMINATWQRVHDKIAIKANYEEIQDCNYLYFNNVDQAGKFWFCFITSIEFVNQEVCNVFFEVDVFQTWFDINTIRPSFIERQHTNDDTIGANLIPEGLETGEYVYNTGVFSEPYNDLVKLTPCIMLAVSEVIGSSSAIPYVVDHTFTGLSYFYADMSYAGNVKELVESYAQAGKADAIVSIFMFPREFLLGDSGTPESYGWITEAYAKTSVLTGGNVTNITAPLNGYTPKNNKLYTYPYRAIELYGSGGGAHEYRYEFFNSYTNMFSVFTTFGGSAPIIAVPNNYKNLSINLEEPTQMNPYPTCSWVNDNYKNWYAQNMLGLNMSTAMAGINGVAGFVGGIATGNLGGAINSGMGAINTVLNNLVSREQHSIIPDTAKGNVASTASYFANGQFYFYLFPKCIKAEFAISIDNFFSMYGYKTNKTAIPNLRGRRSWNYIKLSEANIAGDMPNEAYLKIKQSLEAGVTFWHTNDIKNYNLDNSII